MSTPDQLLYSALHGTAMRYAAEKRDLAESITELRQIANGRNDTLAEAAGIEAGAWCASPGTQLDHMSIACPSVLVYNEPTRRKPARGDGGATDTRSSRGGPIEVEPCASQTRCCRSRAAAGSPR
jgi:hypothetical protein